MTTTSKASKPATEIIVTNKDNGVAFDAMTCAKSLVTSAAELAAEARSKASKVGTISANTDLKMRFPSDPELTESILAIENVMAYYSINTNQSLSRNSLMSSSLVNTQIYYESVLRTLKDTMCKYLNRSLTNRCFGGKVSRSTHFTVDLTRSATNNDLYLYSIQRIVMGKHGKTKSGGKSNNYFEFIFSDDGVLTDKNIVAESMPKVFTEEAAALILDDIDILLERFNKSIQHIADNAYRQTLGYKFKNHKSKQADFGERLLETLTTLKDSVVQEIQEVGV